MNAWLLVLLGTFWQGSKRLSIRYARPGRQGPINGKNIEEKDATICRRRVCSSAIRSSKRCSDKMLNSISAIVLLLQMANSAMVYLRKRT